MKIITKIIAVFLAVTVTVSMTGCAYNHPNPILRDASYGATAGALPGLAMMGILAEVDDDDETTDDELNFFGLSLIVLGGGAIAGLAIGAVVGVFHWMYQTATWEPPQETLIVPAETATQSSLSEPDTKPAAVQQVEYETVEEPAAVRQGSESAIEESTVDETADAQQNEEPAVAKTAGEDIASDNVIETPVVEDTDEGDYAPQAIVK